MDKNFLDEVLSYFDNERMVYHHYKDKYCYFLLQQLVGNGLSIGDVKKSSLSQLCNKPTVKKWLATIGSRFIEPYMLMGLWPSKVDTYLLSMGEWGGNSPSWQQTCRKGYNLVLQLNFTKSHDRHYASVVDESYQPFSCYYHPIHKKGRNTLAWARIDISEDLSEALIEEVQSDWLREVEWTYQMIKGESANGEPIDRYGVKSSLSQFEGYIKNQILPVKKIWQEATLLAAIEFLSEKIGVDKIFYYDFDTGVKLKQMTDSLPPRSLYRRLPKKFGFQTCRQGPSFLMQDKYALKKIKKIEQPLWYCLEI